MRTFFVRVRVSDFNLISEKKELPFPMFHFSLHPVECESIYLLILGFPRRFFVNGRHHFVCTETNGVLIEEMPCLCTFITLECWTIGYLLLFKMNRTKGTRLECSLFDIRTGMATEREIDSVASANSFITTGQRTELFVARSSFYVGLITIIIKLFSRRDGDEDGQG